MKKSKLLPVALMYVGGTGVRGSTRMQKLVFLAQEEQKVPKSFDYQPGPFGPYSPELEETLDQLREKDLIEKDVRPNEVGNETHYYTLTPSGILLGQKMAKDEGLKPYLDVGKQLKETYDDWYLDRLIRHVYREYPIYATESELDLERLHNVNTRSQFLESGTVHGEQKYIGPSPEEVVQNRESVEEFFSTG